MAILKTIIKLRRDTLLNYSKVGNHVPLNGEVCLVDTVNGVRTKIGDGKSSFRELPFTDSMIIQGYYKSDVDKFYKEVSYTTELLASENILYIDKTTNCIYYYNGKNYIKNTLDFPTATADKAGILKLYSTHGQNTDGTMTQKAITDAIDAIAFDIEIDEQDEANSSLFLNKPW